MTNHHASTPEKKKSGMQILLLAGVLVLGLLVLIASLDLNSHAGLATENEDTERGAERLKNLATLQAADASSLTTYGWNDKAKGIVHIPITNAMRLVLPALNSRTQTPTQQ